MDRGAWGLVDYSPWGCKGSNTCEQLTHMSQHAKPLQSNCLQPYVAPQAPLSMEFSRQEYWSGLPFPSPGDPPDPGIEPGSPALQADSLPSEPLGSPYPKELKVI